MLSKGFLALTMMLPLGLPLAHAGGESHGGGADEYRPAPAFFLDSRYEKPVTACVEASAGFGVAPERLKQMVQTAFKKWGNYIVAKKINIVPGHSLIRTQLDMRTACAGDENLAFYFGTENDRVLKYRGQWSKPYAFAQLDVPAQQTISGDGWIDSSGARAFIWVAPSGWVDPEQGIPNWGSHTEKPLEALVLHEVGHVFGNDHVDGTVMTPQIGRYLGMDTVPGAEPRSLPYYAEIDAQLELVPCMDCRMAYEGLETFDMIHPDRGSDWVQTFQTLVGKAPVGKIGLKYIRTGSPLGSGRLELNDSQGAYNFTVDAYQEDSAGRPDSAKLFSQQGGVDFHSSGASYSATIRTMLGQTLDVTVNYNMEIGRKAEIRPRHKGFYPRPLFVSGN